MAIDTVGGLDRYNSRKRYLHLAIDCFLRFMWATSSRNQKAKDFCDLINQIMKVGRPKEILSDNYPALRLVTFKNFLASHGIKMNFIAPYTPKSNCMIERANQTIIDRLRCKFHENPTKSWVTLVDQCVNEYNDSIHESTGFSPRFLLTGVSRFESMLDNCPDLKEARKKSL